jgi:hypothetical protein
MADHFAFHREQFVQRPYLNIQHHCITVPSLILARKRREQFPMDFRNKHVPRVKKAAGKIINCGTHRSYCRDKNKH